MLNDDAVTATKRRSEYTTGVGVHIRRVHKEQTELINIFNHHVMDSSIRMTHPPHRQLLLPPVETYIDSGIPEYKTAMNAWALEPSLTQSKTGKSGTSIASSSQSFMDSRHNQKSTRQRLFNVLKKIKFEKLLCVFEKNSKIFVMSPPKTQGISLISIE
jgi:hypothetical protein